LGRPVLSRITRKEREGERERERERNQSPSEERDKREREGKHTNVLKKKIARRKFDMSKTRHYSVLFGGRTSGLSHRCDQETDAAIFTLAFF
jgi:hypothetical protein